MTALLYPLAYAALLGGAVPVPLARAGWVIRAPRLAIVLWRALSVSWLASLALAGLVAAGPWLPGGPAQPPPGAPAAMVIGATLIGAIIVRVGRTAARELRRTRRERRRHAEGLTLTGRVVPELGATILDQDAPAVYCLPVPRQAARIVVTSGALRLLAPEQLDAVLAHERAHLAQRHHSQIQAAGILARALPGIPLLRHAHRQIATLAEMAADDRARAQHDARALAGAMVALATAGGPAAALGAGGHPVHTAIRRLERLLSPPPPLPLPARVAAAGGVTGALAAPVALACTSVAALVTLLAGAILGH